MNFKQLLLAGTLTIAGIAMLPFTANATGDTGCTTIPDPYSGNYYQMSGYFESTLSRDGTTGTAVITRKSDKPLCSDQPMVFESFNLGPNWNGTPDSAESFLSSLPQTKAYATHFTFAKNAKTMTVTVQTPAACKGTQIDTYVGDKEFAQLVNPHDDNLRNITGTIFQGSGACEVAKVDVCDAATGKIISVAETDKSKYEATSSDKCTTIQVCTIESGDTKMQTITKAKYNEKVQSTNADDCKKPETPATPATPTKTETPATPAAPVAELPHTGPLGFAGGLTGVGALAYSIYAYIASRRGL